jgi:8-oxo-dGTP diphosphatase
MATLIVAAAVIIEDGRVLLTRRPRGTHLENLWEFPGGKLEDGESPEAALARELREELGIDARATQILDVTFWRYPERDVLLLFYRAERLGRGPLRNLGVAAHAWVSLEDLDRYSLPPADVAVVSRVRVLLGARSQ